MIDFQKTVLKNGLTVITHQDKGTPLAAVNILYKVGSKNEHPERTGFAHLFEHLMFGGSANIPDYDKVSHSIGANNNAFTNTDITNYYLSFPSQNLETALWLESDRMAKLDFSQQSLDVQKSVVVEEFKQRYLNQPYGDVWLKLRPLAFQKHPYQWATIGKEVAHIEDAQLDEVEAFFYKHYRPNNAIISVCGNINHFETLELVDKWFGGIEKNKESKLEIQQEDPQNELRRITVEADVPLDALYMAFHMPARKSKEYYAADLISDVLSRGKSGRLQQSLVRQKQIFNQLNAYVSGELDPGLLIISGKINPGVPIELAEKEVWKLLEEFKQEEISEIELKKNINQIEADQVMGGTSILNVGMRLCFAENLDDIFLVNEEINYYRAVTSKNIKEMANTLLQEKNCSILHYKGRNAQC